VRSDRCRSRRSGRAGSRREPAVRSCRGPVLARTAGLGDSILGRERASRTAGEEQHIGLVEERASHIVVAGSPVRVHRTVEVGIGCKGRTC
jgi:hypothetical protein